MDPVAARALREFLSGVTKAGTVVVDGSKWPNFMKNVCMNALKGVDEAVDEALINDQIQKKFEQMTNEDATIVKVQNVEQVDEALSLTHEPEMEVDKHKSEPRRKGF